MPQKQSSGPSQHKALPGSWEERRDRVGAAIRAAGLFGNGGGYVSDTFDDYVVVEVWNWDSSTRRFFRVEYTMTDDEVEIGTVQPVDKVTEERLVGAGADVAVEPDAGSEVEDGEGTVAKGRTPKLKHRQLPLHIKSLTPVDDGVGGWDAHGVFSVYNHVDHSKDVVLPGASADSIQARLPKIKDHHGETIGQGTKAWEDKDGLNVEFRIYPTPAGEKVATLMQPIDTDQGPAAPVEQGSIGFSVPEGGAKRNKHGGFDFTKIDVWEVSLVTFGDNDQTHVNLKSREEFGGLNTAEALRYAADITHAAIYGENGAKALHARRVREGRALKSDQVDALEEYLATVMDATAEAAHLVEKSGLVAKFSRASRVRHIAAVVEALTRLLDGSPEKPDAKRDDDEDPPKASAGGTDAAEGEEDDDDKEPAGRARARGAGGGGTGSGKEPAKAGGKAATPPGPEGLRALEANLMRAEMSRLGMGLITEV